MSVVYGSNSYVLSPQYNVATDIFCLSINKMLSIILVSSIAFMYAVAVHSAKANDLIRFSQILLNLGCNSLRSSSENKHLIGFSSNLKSVVPYWIDTVVIYTSFSE